MLSARACNAQHASDAASRAGDRRRLDKVVMVRSAKSSPAGLTRGSITFARVNAHFPKRMDCRGKPGNDGGLRSGLGGEKTKRRPRNVTGAAQILSARYAKVRVVS